MTRNAQLATVTWRPRFADGLRYRIEIPSVEGPAVLKAVLDEAERREVPVRRVSQGSGVMMLTDDEVRDAIGPHGPGSSDLRNEYGLQSCWWTATTAQKFDAYPNGWFDSVEVVVFDKLRESWAREHDAAMS